MHADRPTLKVIKDAFAGAAEAEGAARVRVLNLSSLPFSVYVLVEFPAGLPPPSLSVRLFDEAARPPLELRRETVPLPPPPRRPGESDGLRRLLVLLAWPGAPEGRYRIVLSDDKDVLASAELVRRPDHLRSVPLVAFGSGPLPTPALLSGSPKSGTTWLEKIVSAHPDSLVLHEGNTLNLFDHGELTRQLDARHEHFRFKNYIAWFNPAYDAGDLARFVQIAAAREILTAFGRAWGARLVADRTSNYADFYLHLLRFWPELRIVHIVRHPLDVLVSRMFHEANLARNPDFPVDLPRPFLDRLNARIDSGAPIETGNYLTDAEAGEPGFAFLMRDWRREQRRFLGASRANPASFHLLRYERLVKDFAAEAARLFAFLGTDPARTDLDAIRQATSFVTLSGGRDPGQSNPRSFFRKGIVGDWRHIFSPAQARTLWAYIADTAAPLDYELD